MERANNHTQVGQSPIQISHRREKLRPLDPLRRRAMTNGAVHRKGLRHSAADLKQPAMGPYCCLVLATGALGRTPPHGSAGLFGASVVFEASR
jgi:hypothetical protein